MKINVGDYVRTNFGCICKIVNINEFREPSMKYGVEASYLKDIMFIGDENIIKSSKNIIDLIEVEDYVNGMRVKDINDVAGFVIVNTSSISENTIFSYNIKSIVTKQQFESMKYKIN